MTELQQLLQRATSSEAANRYQVVEWLPDEWAGLGEAWQSWTQLLDAADREMDVDSRSVADVVLAKATTVDDRRNHAKTTPAVYAVSQRPVPRTPAVLCAAMISFAMIRLVTPSQTTVTRPKIPAASTVPAISAWEDDWDRRIADVRQEIARVDSDLTTSSDGSYDYLRSRIQQLQTEFDDQPL